MAFASIQGFERLAGLADLSRQPQAIRARLLLLERLLEGLIRLPGNRRVGLDAVIGLVPVAGDIVSATIGTYLVWEARNMGMPRWRCAQMLARVGMDAAIGAVPLVGDLFDFIYRANTKNVKALLVHLERRHPGVAVVEGLRL